ncbi:MAG: lysophospholipid acyltransferase family protein [Aquisalimonadaceae bacterium]
MSSAPRAPEQRSDADGFGRTDGPAAALARLTDIISRSAADLPTSSALHGIPHLLTRHQSMGLAFDQLRTLSQQATDTLTRELARTCLGLTQELRREYEFFGGLHTLYDTITSLPETVDAGEARAICDRAFLDVFKCVNYRIEGMHNIPRSGGNIIVLNHHTVHTYYTLPNSFQLTLDTHFVSSFLSYDIRGTSPLRAVRESRATETAHNAYYNRLGHLIVKAPGSDHYDPESRKARREAFFQEARNVLLSGTDILICHEGTSYASEDSPGPFRSGAFHLAAQVDPEPLIVPVAIANFDKRLPYHTLGVHIGKPFRASETVNTNNKVDMAHFLDRFRQEYKGHIEKATLLSTRK